MYPGEYAHARADQPAFIMASTGEAVTYAEQEARTNRLAHFLRSRGLTAAGPLLDLHGEQRAATSNAAAAGERSGLYYTCINSYLTPDEVAYIVNNSESKVLITSDEKRTVATEALKQCPDIEVAVDR